MPSLPSTDTPLDNGLPFFSTAPDASRDCFLSPGFDSSSGRCKSSPDQLSQNSPVFDLIFSFTNQHRTQAIFADLSLQRNPRVHKTAHEG
ncbi:hypothetical protein CSUI_007917, partial [Cystoisospora suis]